MSAVTHPSRVTVLARSLGTCQLLRAVALLLVLGIGAARGQVNTWVQVGAPLEAPGNVHDMVEFDDGGGPALWVGGDFTTIGGVAANHLARWRNGSWTSVPAPSGPVVAMAVLDSGAGPRLYVASEQPSGAPQVIIYRRDGGTWTAVGSPSSGFINGLDTVDDGSGPALWVTGYFLDIGGVAASHVARFDGTSWSSPGGGVGNTAYCAASFDDGTGPAVYVGVNSASGFIARFNGTNWSAVGSGANALHVGYWVKALQVHDDGSGPALYAGGDFNSPGQNIARWNGSTWSPLGAGIGYGGVTAMTIFDFGAGPELCVGGIFSSAGGAPAGHVARWNGSSWSAVAGGVNLDVEALVVHDDGNGARLHVGGTPVAGGGAPSVAVCVPATPPGTLIVDAAATSPGNGTAANPFQNIQDGLAAATHGDTIEVRPGTYVENLNLLGKTLTLVAPSGAQTTIIDGSQSGPVITVPGGDAVIEGFTLTNGLGGTETLIGGIERGEAGAVHVTSSGNLTVRRCVVRGNRGGDGFDPFCSYWPCPAQGGPGAVFARGVVSLEGCLFTSNVGGDSSSTAWGVPGVAASDWGTQLLISHCTMAGNQGGRGGDGGYDNYGGFYTGAPGGAGAVGMHGGTTQIVNCILFGDQGGPAGTSPAGVPPGPVGVPEIQGGGPGSLVMVSNSNIAGGFSGSGNISANPLWVDPFGGDFHLLPSSPCIDAGQLLPNSALLTDIDGDPRVFHGLPDMGADETVLTQVIAQAAPGAPITITNHNLTPGTEYYNLFTSQPCGPTAVHIPQLGICGDWGFLLSQFTQPIGAAPFHFIANADSMTFGPYPIPPLTIQGVCFAWQAGSLGFVSRTTTFVVQ